MTVCKPQEGEPTRFTLAIPAEAENPVCREAYEDALHRRNVEIRPELVVESSLRFEECGYRGVLSLLREGRSFTGLFAAYDSIAVGAMRALWESGLRVPEDVSVVSIDDIRIARYLNVRLTTVAEPTQDLGELAANLLMMKIRGKWKTIQNIKLKPTLKIRETAAPPAAGARTAGSVRLAEDAKA